MPVTTRLQLRKMLPECTRQFKETIENPCVLQVILGNLKKEDIANMKCLSKDERYNDVIDNKLKALREDKKRVLKVTKYIKKRLDKTERTKKSAKKYTYTIEIYEYICENLWFIRRYDKFNEVVHNKLFQLMSEHPPFKADGLKYLEKLYGLKPPMDYYDSKQGLSRYGMFNKNGEFVDIER